MDKLKACELLGVRQDATEEEIKTAYRAMAQKYNAEHYEAGPLRDEAEAKMSEINEAFDSLMSYLRTGHDASDTGYTSSAAPAHSGNYPAIRRLINEGDIDAALRELAAVEGGPADAEWNFLMGSAYYYRGWLDQAVAYFREAVRLAPGNREYEAALRNLTGAAEGDMQGNPYVGQDPGSAAATCACNTCSLLCCMDACCGMCRGC